MDLGSANKELKDLIEIAQFTASEKQRFLSQVSKDLKNRKVNLDFFNDF